VQALSHAARHALLPLGSHRLAPTEPDAKIHVATSQHAEVGRRQHVPITTNLYLPFTSDL